MPLGAFKAALMGTAGVSTAGDVVLLSTQTASDSASLSFTSDITSTYGEYIFKFYNINPASNGAALYFNMSTDGGSNYDVVKTTSAFYALHGENDDNGNLQYDTSLDLAESAAYTSMWVRGIGNGADESGVGELHLFNPASTTYVKHFFTRCSCLQEDDRANNGFVAGYGNTTSAINAVDFKPNTGNFDGKIKMWGVK